MPKPEQPDAVIFPPFHFISVDHHKEGKDENITLLFIILTALYVTTA